MKTIKFRFWLGHTKKMTYGHTLENINAIIPEFTEDIVPLQFTGLKDKNDKEIYEGDILGTVTDKPMVVGWSKKYASFVLNRNGWAFSHYFGESCNPEECEIIGNIYENSELINELNK